MMETTKNDLILTDATIESVEPMVDSEYYQDTIYEEGRVGSTLVEVLIGGVIGVVIGFGLPRVYQWARYQIKNRRKEKEVEVFPQEAEEKGETVLSLSE